MDGHFNLQAGKGRTGLMVSSYLVYATGMSSEKALQMYAEKRTTNNQAVSFTGYRLQQTLSLLK